jgi:hypothetical protein
MRGAYAIFWCGKACPLESPGVAGAMALCARRFCREFTGILQVKIRQRVPSVPILVLSYVRGACGYCVAGYRAKAASYEERASWGPGTTATGRAGLES